MLILDQGESLVIMDNEIRLKAMSIEPARAFNADLDQACCTGDFKAGNSAFKTNAIRCRNAQCVGSYR